MARGVPLWPKSPRMRYDMGMFDFMSKHIGRIVLGIVLLTSAMGVALFAHAAATGEAKTLTPTPVVVHCVGDKAMDFSCWRNHFEQITEHFGSEIALKDLTTLYARDSYVVSQCHQLTHTIGNVTADHEDIATAFSHGDSICWSGYYHGIVERAVNRVGKENFLAEADQLCAKIPGKETKNFNYYNCVHGVGHGVMAATKNELFESLKLCDGLSGDWEQRSCYGGAFMENIMADNRNHHTDYLKKDDLMYPCNAVDQRYKEECYKMQTSYALSQNGRNFKNLFELCSTADVNYRNTCALSIGRDASGSSVSNKDTTIATCSLALNDDQEKYCFIGAVKDFVSYFHGDKEARGLCDAVPAKFQESCETALIQHLSTLK